MNTTAAAPAREPYESERSEILLAEDKAAITETNDPRSPVVQHLQHQLANSILLFLEYKKCSWQSEGIAFRSLRETFDSFANQTKGIFDQLGERLRMIGQDPDLILDSIIDGAGIKQSPTGMSFQDLLANADANVIAVIRELRDAIADLRNNGDDPGSMDLLVSIVRQHEEHEWFLRQMMKSDAAATSK